MHKPCLKLAKQTCFWGVILTNTKGGKKCWNNSTVLGIWNVALGRPTVTYIMVMLSAQSCWQ